jgi:hypothetical protein
MSKRLTVLMCVLILTGFATLATAQPTPAAAQPLTQPAFFSQGASCPQATLPGTLVPAPIPMAGNCQGWQYGSCDRRAECTGFYCPWGEVKTCVGGTGSGCLGICGCV